MTRNALMREMNRFCDKGEIALRGKCIKKGTKILSSTGVISEWPPTFATFYVSLDHISTYPASKMDFFNPPLLVALQNI